MQLPNFISQSLAFFKTAEAHQAKVEAALGDASAAQAEVVRLTGELAARDVTIAANASALADFEGRVSAAVLTANATAKASQEAAEAVAAKASADLAALIADPSEQARLILAKTGTAPAAKAKSEASSEVVTVAEYRAMSPHQAKVFFAAGGKLAE